MDLMASGQLLSDCARSMHEAHQPGTTHRSQYSHYHPRSVLTCFHHPAAEATEASSTSKSHQESFRNHRPCAHLHPCPRTRRLPDKISATALISMARRLAKDLPHRSHFPSKPPHCRRCGQHTLQLLSYSNNAAARQLVSCPADEANVSTWCAAARLSLKQLQYGQLKLLKLSVLV